MTMKQAGAPTLWSGGEHINMARHLSMFSLIYEVDLEPILEGVSFPLTKAELKHRARMVKVPLPILDMINKLPARFYRSRSEVIGELINRMNDTVTCLKPDTDY